MTACMAHLEGQTSPEASIRLISTIFVCYCTPFLGDRDSDNKNAKFVPGRPSRRCLCIGLAITAFLTYLEGQTSPEASIPLISTIFVCYNKPFLGDPDSDVKNAKFFSGRPSRPFLCIRLSITAFPTHLEGQTSPEASIRLILTIFVCYCTPFLGDRDSDVKNAKFVRGRPSRRCLCIR